MRHKWTKGPWPNECVNCGLIRRRETVKFLMAITNKPPYNHYKYETVVTYLSPSKKYTTAPNCKRK